MNDHLETQGYIHTTGGRIFYRLFGELSQGKEPLIVLHGGPGACHDPLLVLRALAPAHPVIFYDQLGCGRSDRPTSVQAWTVARYADELAEILQHFQLARYALLGHSFGGSIALSYAARQPKGLCRLVLSSPLVSVKDWLSDTEIRKKSLPKVIQRIIAAHEAAGSTDSSAYQAAVAAFNQSFLCRLNPQPVVYQQAKQSFNVALYQAMWGPSEFHCTGSLKDYEAENLLATLRLSILWLCGEYDEIRAQTLERYLLQSSAGSHLHVFAGASHCSYLEATTAYIDVLQHFLRVPASH